MKKRREQEVHELCRAVKRIREAFGESQERFAQRVGLTAQSISRFERGAMIPRDADTLYKLANAAHDCKGLEMETTQLVDAYKEANRRESATKFDVSYWANQMIPYQTLEEWRVMQAARIAVRYEFEEAIAIRKAAPRSMAIVDSALRGANTDRNIDADFYIGLEQHLMQVVERRTVERVRQEEQ